MELVRVEITRELPRIAFGRTFGFWGPVGGVGELPAADAALLTLLEFVKPLSPLSDGVLRAAASAAFPFLEAEPATRGAERRLARVARLVGVEPVIGGDAA